jgi:hypothetical protein
MKDKKNEGKGSGFHGIALFQANVMIVTCHTMSHVCDFTEDCTTPPVLVRPKNITSGSNRLQFIWKAALHLSSSLMQTLLKPYRTSNLVKYFASLD